VYMYVTMIGQVTYQVTYQVRPHLLQGTNEAIRLSGPTSP